MEKTFKFKNRTCREIQDSKIMVAKVIDEWKEKQNNGEVYTYRKHHWDEATKPINLGSVKNPNKKITKLKIIVPHGKQTQRFGIDFSNLFK